MDLFSASVSESRIALPDGDQYNADWNETLQGFDIRVPHGHLFYSEKFFTKKISDRCVQYFQENDAWDFSQDGWEERTRSSLDGIKFTHIQWKQDSLKMYGKSIPLPRLTAWYGDKGKSYTYSGITSHPHPWNDGLLYLKNEIEGALGHAFNSVLLNWYRDGEDHMGWHADDEVELGQNPVVASANFGASRDFVIRLKHDKSKKITFPLTHGSLLLMAGELQHFWEHSVPKRKRVRESRFNLTFRNIR